MLKRILPVGRRSTIIGVHQFLWHPFTVFLAWRKLYGTPSFREIICVFIHDWGYWTCSDIDGEEGIKHPELGANIALELSPGCCLDLNTPSFAFTIAAAMRGRLASSRVNFVMQINFQLRMNPGGFISPGPGSAVNLVSTAVGQQKNTTYLNQYLIAHGLSGLKVT